MPDGPFIIDADREKLPNLSVSPEEYPVEYTAADIWSDSDDIMRLLKSIDEKLDFAIRLLQKGANNKKG